MQQYRCDHPNPGEKPAARAFHIFERDRRYRDSGAMRGQVVDAAPVDLKMPSVVRSLRQCLFLAVRRNRSCLIGMTILFGCGITHNL
jgi:hypothetical protein